MKAINLSNWIKEHEELMVPPVGNRTIWTDTDFIVMIIKGPNNRNDFHVNCGEEFFYQLKGSINLRIHQHNQFENITLNEGDIFLLPPNTPHSPQRPEGSIGMVIEKKRLKDELDSFVWFCDQCGQKLYQEDFHLTDIVNQFPPIFERFYQSFHNKCQNCGYILEKNK